MADDTNVTRTRVRTARGERTFAGWAPILLSALALVGCGTGPEEEFGVQNPAAPAEYLATTQTGWRMHYGQTPEQVASLLGANNAWRLVSLQVESGSPLKLTVAMVENTGSHAKTAWWYYGQTGAQLHALATSLGARITSLSPYVVNGTTYFAAVLVRDTGADAKRWWWYPEVSWSQVWSLLQQNGARPTELHQYSVSGQTRFAVVMLANAGADSTPWWLYGGITPAQISSFVQQHGASLVAIEPSSPAATTFNVIMVPNPGLAWWYYTGTSSDVLDAAIAQDGARPLDVKSYFVNGTGPRRFAAIVVDYTDPEAGRIRSILSRAGGKHGLYLKKIGVGGGVEESLGERVGFDPASTIKTLVAASVMRAVEAGRFDLGTSISHRLELKGGSSCPDNSETWRDSTIEELLRAMLVYSDNVATRALIDHAAGGFQEVNGVARVAGMASTSVWGYPGCAGNVTTLSDMARLYEGIANLTLVNGSSRSTLYARMPADGGDFTFALGRALAIAESEGLALGLSGTAREAFKRNIRLHYKAGSGTWNGMETRSIAGLAEIPRCAAPARGAYASDLYEWSVFIDSAPYDVIAWNGNSAKTRVDQTFEDAQAEPLRKAIRDRLAGWSACSW